MIPLIALLIARTLMPVPTGAMRTHGLEIPVAAVGSCALPPLMHQREDVATVERLETAWSVAFLQGDVLLERCLLTPDFAEILRGGETKYLADELGFAEANRGQHRPIPDFPKPVVLLHGDAAVAYGTSQSVSANGTPRITRYADFYLWEAGRWHAFFAQQTPVESR